MVQFEDFLVHPTLVFRNITESYLVMSWDFCSICKKNSIPYFGIFFEPVYKLILLFKFLARVGKQPCNLCCILAILFKLCVYTYLVQTRTVELTLYWYSVIFHCANNNLFLIILFTESGNTESSVYGKRTYGINA